MHSDLKVQNSPSQLHPSDLKASFFDLSPEELKKWLSDKGFPSYRADQIWTALYQKGQTLDQATTLPLPLREKLKEFFSFDLLTIESCLDSQDGSKKLLLKGTKSGLFECVIMPTEKRQTLCISSQAGCRMGCTFCQTGKLGLLRNLSAGEMLSQILLANQLFPLKKVTHIVFMGMGEPLDNFDEVKKAILLFCHPRGLALNPKHITLSTCGLVEEIEKMTDWPPVKLAISFHTPFDEERNAIMPVNRRYPLAILKKALLEYQRQKDEVITLEYVMIAGKNDSLKHAAGLVHFIHGMRAKVNLIPMNSHPGSAMQTSSPEQIALFQNYLSKRSIPAPIRYSRGSDVSAACGQLASKHRDELLLDPREVASKRRQTLREEKKAHASLQ